MWEVEYRYNLEFDCFQKVNRSSKIYSKVFKGFKLFDLFKSKSKSQTPKVVLRGYINRNPSHLEHRNGWVCSNASNYQERFTKLHGCISDDEKRTEAIINETPQRSRKHLRFVLSESFYK